MSRLRVAVVGVGHLGRIHARLAAAAPEIELVAVADPVPTLEQEGQLRAATDKRREAAAARGLEPSLGGCDSGDPP